MPPGQPAAGLLDIASQGRKIVATGGVAAVAASNTVHDARMIASREGPSGVTAAVGGGGRALASCGVGAT